METRVRVLDVTNIAGSGNGGNVDMANARNGDVTLFLNVTGFTGTSMAITIEAMVGPPGSEVAYEIPAAQFEGGSGFAAVTGVSKQVRQIKGCPAKIRVVYTHTAVTDFDATMDAVSWNN